MMTPRQLDRNQIIAAVITAISSLLIYYFNQIHQIDSRLDKLEQEAGVLLDNDGSIRPSQHSIDSYYNTKLLEQRLRIHEEKGH
jgi:hypothetical protein